MTRKRHEKKLFLDRITGQEKDLKERLKDKNGFFDGIDRKKTDLT